MIVTEEEIIAEPGNVSEEIFSANTGEKIFPLNAPGEEELKYLGTGEEGETTA